MGRHVLPPLVAVALVLLVWQVADLAGDQAALRLPVAGRRVVDHSSSSGRTGTLLEAIWLSLSRGVLGFLARVAIGTPLGLAVARVKPLRTALGPVCPVCSPCRRSPGCRPRSSGSALSPATIYFVVLLGAVPSIANGLISGIDQVPPLYLRVGRVLGARGLGRSGTWCCRRRCPATSAA